jgi:hypothetical protein
MIMVNVRFFWYLVAVVGRTDGLASYAHDNGYGQYDQEPEPDYTEYDE